MDTNTSWYDKLLDTVKDVAPTLAGGAATVATGGNVGVGSLVSSIIGKVVGESNPDLEKAAQSILGDPDKMLDFRSRMRDAEIKELEIRTKDVQSARNTLDKSHGAVWISILIVAAFTALLGIVMFVAIPAASQAVAYILMGTLASEFSKTSNFWLGSSISDKEKEKTINAFASAAQKDQAVRAKQSQGLYKNIGSK